MKPDPDQDIYERDNWVCQYCGEGSKEDFEVYLRASLCIDHIKPKKHGGSEHDPNNKVVACHVCNKLKGQRDCDSVERGREIIAQQRELYRKWFDKYVRKEGVSR